MKNLLITSIFIIVVGLSGCVKIDINTGKNLDHLKFSVESPVPEGSKITYDTVIVFDIKKPKEKFSLEVSNISGDIKILKSDGNNVRAILKYRDDAKKYYKVYEYSSPSKAKIIIKTKEKWLDLKKDKGEIDITLFVPDNLGDISISSVNGDIITLDPLKGAEINLSTVNGDIKGNVNAHFSTLSSVNGSIKVIISADSVNVDNVNGSIKVTLKNFDEVDINEVNGSVSVSLLADIGIKGEANTVNGSIHYSELEELPNFTVLEKNTRSLWHLNGGSLKFRIGSGKSYLHISTVNGSISFHIRGRMI